MGGTPNFFRLLGVDTKILSDTDPIYGFSDSCEVDDDGHGWCFPGQEMKFGEVYFDITLARIVIADSESFNMEDRNRFHYEMQIPTAWNETGASFKVKKGTFENNQNVWIFLFNSEGLMSEGFMATFTE